MTKKLFRSTTDKKLTGVCGGLGAYFGLDSNIIRLIWVIFGLSGVGIVAYLACALLLPEAPTN